MNEDQALGPEDWTRRRRVVFLTLVYCAVVEVYLLGWGVHSSALHDTIATANRALAGVVITGYLGLPAVGDWHRRRSYTALRTSPRHNRPDDPDG